MLCFARASCICKELYDLMDAKHLAYYGRKNAWRVAVLECLQRRYNHETLRVRLVVKAPKTSEASTPATKPLPLNEAKTKEQPMFPKGEPVEAEPVFPQGEPVEEEADQKKLEEIMERWHEMVESVNMLEAVNWLDDLPESEENKQALDMIFKQGMMYCSKYMEGVILPWNLKDWPLNPRVWLCEFERVLKTMAKRSMLPYWLRRPADRNIRDDAHEAAAGFSDPGNYTLDIMVHALRLWRYCEASRVDLVIRQPLDEYGARSNKSAHGPVNLRGNIIEAMSKNLQTMGGSRRAAWCKYDPYVYWYESQKKEDSSDDWGDWTGSGKTTSRGSSSSWRWRR